MGILDMSNVQPRKKVKVTVNLPEDTVAELKELADSKQISLTDAIRRAIHSDAFFTKQEKAGRKILVEEPDRSLKQIVRP